MHDRDESFAGAPVVHRPREKDLDSPRIKNMLDEIRSDINLCKKMSSVYAKAQADAIRGAVGISSEADGEGKQDGHSPV